MVLREDAGTIIYRSCRQLFSCHDALQAGLLALNEGLNLALQWSNLPIAVETDCLEASNLLKASDIDRSRSNKEFLYHILEEVIQAGATTITIADTVGSNLPVEYGKLIADIKANTPGIDNAIISTHCHNDLGLATANTLAGAYAGARQLEVTINGIGERAGNAALEEVVMALKCRPELLDGMYTGINTHHITMTSKMVQEYSGLHVQPHKAIVGANAFAHESGIHQDGMLKYKGTYEIISPDDIGLTRANDSGIVLGKLSGRHAVRSVLVELGYEISDNEFEDFFKRYKEVAEKKKVRINDKDIKALLYDEIFKPKLNPSVGSNNMPGGASGHVLGSLETAHGTSTSQQQ
ncbi:unnamed protein product [Triticum turgidum subsp. durum]|uniref:2-isopropylmalate synthase n=1 Tax=Triticum turgidum subsp. durum TaxID=4567 RepID=A0A9R0Z8Y7_TRITD|nr:unnamed protein product [Triticum turgidum subsp. durum]